MGAVTFSYELARALGVRALFAERVPEGGFALRRGFAVLPGERVLVAEDVVTTGKSAGEVLTMLEQMGVPAAAVASIANRSGGDAPFGALPFYRAVDLEVPSWEPDSCTLCADPGAGSRDQAGQPAARPSRDGRGVRPDRAPQHDRLRPRPGGEPPGGGRGRTCARSTGKGLHLKLRMPSERLALEPELETLVRKNVERGSLQGTVRVRLTHTKTAEFDLEVLQAHLKSWRRAEKALGLTASEPTLRDLLALPDAARDVEEPVATTRAVRSAVLAATKDALADLRRSRESEGSRLGREMARLAKRLGGLRVKVERRQPVARREAEQRLQERLAKAWAAMDTTAPVDLARELVLISERADIQEELARLEIHLERLAALLAAGGAAGRELEFLLQECQREVTTLGNKASDPVLSELVVAMKLVVQQMREQVANVE